MTLYVNEVFSLKGLLANCGCAHSLAQPVLWHIYSGHWGVLWALGGSQVHGWHTTECKKQGRVPTPKTSQSKPGGEP